MTQHRIDPADRIPFGQKLAFAAGVNTDFIANGLLQTMLIMPFFNIGMGMSPALIGVVLMVFKAWDAITDPLIGNISDNARTRWGRRRPFMLIGALCAAACYPLFWFMPHGLGTYAQAAWLAVVGLIFYTSYTFWSIPYFGLQLELTPNYDERTRLAAWMAVFGKTFWLCAGWFFSLVMLLGSVATGVVSEANDADSFLYSTLEPLRPVLAMLSGAAQNTDMPPVVAGMRLACWLLVAAILVFGLLPVFFVKERYYENHAARQEKEPFWQSIRDSLRCAPLWNLIGIAFFLTLGTSSVTGLGQYMNFYYVNGGDLNKGAFIGAVRMSATVGVGLLCLPLFTKLGERFDKRSVVLGLLSCAIFGHLLNYVCLTPRYPYLQIVPAIFESCGLGAIWMFLPSMRADVADYDETRSSRRREGSINAFFSFFIKMATTVSLGVSGFVLELSGFQASLSQQADQVLGRMFFLYLLLPVVIWSVSILLVWFYPLTRERCACIRGELEARRGRL